jgi:hypothetical protein
MRKEMKGGSLRHGDATDFIFGQLKGGNGYELN